MCQYIAELEVLQKTYKEFNKKYFGGLLEPVVITIQSDIGNYGRYMCGKVWKIGEGEKVNSLHEINLSAETLNRHYYNVCATLMHEMCHHFCKQNGLQDTSRQGRYHNKLFKKVAEERGLIISYSSAIGWSLTEPTEKFKQFIDSLKFDFQKLYRDTPIKEPKVSSKSTVFKYHCPICDLKIRTSKDNAKLRCLDCNVELTQY